MRASALALLSVLLVSGNLAAQGRPAVIQDVDLSLPVQPQSVRIAGKTHLVYELHITNFQPVDILLSRLQVLSADRSGVSIADYREGELRRRLGRPGLRAAQENPQVIGPGMRAVAFFWIELAEGARPPAAVRHRLELDVLRPSGAVQALVESAASMVHVEAPLVLSPPLRGGPWTAIYDPLLKGGHRTVFYTLNGRTRIPGRFAIDWILLPPTGTMEKEGLVKSSGWNGFGADVLAVGDATVVAATDDIPDNEDDPAPTVKPVEPQNASGNYVTLDLGRGRFATCEHLAFGSVTVKTGDRVSSGRVIGRLGYSGSSSIGPHLHFHVSDAKSPLGAEGLPFVFTRFAHLGAFASLDALIAGDHWLAHPDGHGSVRVLERPGANAVVQFR